MFTWAVTWKSCHSARSNPEVSPRVGEAFYEFDYKISFERPHNCNLLCLGSVKGRKPHGAPEPQNFHRGNSGPPSKFDAFDDFAHNTRAREYRSNDSK